MNTKAIERIKGYCCEVTQEQWEELVRVADEVGCAVGPSSKRDGPCSVYRLVHGYKGALSLCKTASGKEIIPFPDFLAKLRGEEKWQPKAGDDIWFKHYEAGRMIRGIYISYWSGKHIVWDIASQSPAKAYGDVEIIPTITRAEAEKQLGKRIID
jgi:hypothetical protein